MALAPTFADAPGPFGGFHPAVAEWFRRRYPGGATEAQALGWAAVAAGEDTLIAAPTGSGKTLAAFLVAIDRCYRSATWGEGRRGTDVVYVSPLRALTVDVAQNLEQPLLEIAEVAREMGYAVPEIKVAVRNGDTPASERAAMIRTRPEIVVTTPESLYLLLTSVRGRELLGTVRTVIVDEIHALARDKRGSHLALSLERLDRVVSRHEASGPPQSAPVEPGHGRPVRIGLSATQRPISTIARLLVGAGAEQTDAAGEPRCRIVDVGHERPLDVAIELPDDELGAVATHEQIDAVLQRIGRHVAEHRTTLVFVNTRRMAERVAHRLGELVGEDSVHAHHGSLSMERRLRVEARLRGGDLKAVVATASLELGIDVGPIELVCQLGTPRAIATWLQRVGRAQHHVGGTPTGRLYPLTRDELVECTALMAAVRRGELDATVPPVAPLDILAQQVVAEVAAAGPEGIAESELFELVRRATPYAQLDRTSFEEVVTLVSEGVVTGRGRRGAYIHRDGVNAVLRPRRGARLSATTSGGAIPELADYRVVLEPEESFVGTVNEDWAIETMAGDVFLLGTHTWRVRRVEAGTVRVTDAAGASPTVPFWLGEAPARTNELSASVSLLRSDIEHWLERSTASATEWVKEAAGIDDRAAQQVVAYLATARTELGKLPTLDRLVIERFFDDTGGMQLVLHSPRGGRINRGLGLALRKRLCRSFDFELQAAASDDAVVLSLGPQHSFPLSDTVGYLSPSGLRDTLLQAVLPTPIFAARWRWNLSRSLISPRFRGSRHLPPAIQRMEADDLMAAIFPSLAACQENVSGPIEIPDHPIVRQTLHDCCTEAMDLEGLTTVLERLRSGEIEAHFVDAVSPSILSEEILNGRPYTFLDDAPLEERRTRSVQTRRGVPIESRDLSHLDARIVASVAEQARPEPRDPEELHDLLMSLLLVRPQPEWLPWFETLRATGRAEAVHVAAGDEAAGGHAGSPPAGDELRWVATERAAGAAAVLGHRGASMSEMVVAEEALAAAVRAHLEVSAPLRPRDLAERLGLCPSGTPEGDAAHERALMSALARLEGDGSVLRCRVGDEEVDRYSARYLLMRIHSAMRDRSRQSISAVSAQQFVAFLVKWQHVGPGNRLLGSGGLSEIIEQLQGIEAAVESWESAILPARVAGYQGPMLDDLCARGEVGFGRLALRSSDVAGGGRPAGGPAPRFTGAGAPGAARDAGAARVAPLAGDAGAAAGAAPGAATAPVAGRRPGATPSPATPLSMFRRDDLDWLLAAVRGGAEPELPSVGAPADVLAALAEHGALFLTDLCTATGRMPIEVADALWDGIARGLVTADGFQAVRSLLGGRHRLGHLVRDASLRPGLGSGASSTSPRGLPRPGRPRPRVRPALTGGRWALLDTGARVLGAGEHGAGFDGDELAEALAGQLLQRWGVVFRDLVIRELIGIGWREVLWALRRLEARGVVMGGRFVAGFTGEQFALPEAYAQLRSVAASGPEGHSVQLAATDPLNLTGVIVPGPRTPSVRQRHIVIVDGAIIAPAHERGPSGRRATGRSAG